MAGTTCTKLAGVVLSAAVATGGQSWLPSVSPAVQRQEISRASGTAYHIEMKNDKNHPQPVFDAMSKGLQVVLQDFDRYAISGAGGGGGGPAGTSLAAV